MQQSNPDGLEHLLEIPSIALVKGRPLSSTERRVRSGVSCLVHGDRQRLREDGRHLCGDPDLGLVLEHHPDLGVLSRLQIKKPLGNLPNDLEE